ncbi:MAG: hypothetical protein ACW98X_20050 [Promethearchaeota archaeon]
MLNRQNIRHERTSYLNQTGEIPGSTVMNDFGSNAVNDYNDSGSSEYAARADHIHQWLQIYASIGAIPNLADHEIARVQGVSPTVDDGRYQLPNSVGNGNVDICLVHVQSGQPSESVSHLAMFWFDTDDGQIYQRTQANNDWTPLGGVSVITTTNATMPTGEGVIGSIGISRFGVGTQNFLWIKYKSDAWAPVPKTNGIIRYADARAGDMTKIDGKMEMSDGAGNWYKVTHIS